MLKTKEHICVRCEKKFIAKTFCYRKYCTIICKQKHLSFIRNRDRKTKRSFIRINCAQCSVYIERGQKGQKYCGKKCSDIGRKIFLNIPACLEDANRKIDKYTGYVRIYCPMYHKTNTWGYAYEHLRGAMRMNIA